MGYEERPQEVYIRQFGGLNTLDSEIILPNNESPGLQNIDLHRDGSIRGRLGYAVYTAAQQPGYDAGPPIVFETQIDSLIRLDQPSEDEGWLYAIAGGKIYRTVEPGSWAWAEATSTPAVSLVAQNSWGHALARYNDGTEYPHCAYICRKNGAPYIAIGQASPTDDLLPHPVGAWGDGGVGTGTAGYPSSWTTNHWPTHMRLIAVGRGSRMHAWGFADDPEKVYYSSMDMPWNYLAFDPDSPDTPLFTDGGFYYARRGDGDPVTAVIDMFSYTVVFKKRHTLIYTGDPNGSEDNIGVVMSEDVWRLRAEFPVGCVSDRAWVKVGNDLFFWAEDGPRRLSAVQEYGDLATANMSTKIADQVASLFPGNFERVCCYHDIPNMRVIWFVPISTAASNDTAFVYYYATDKWSIWKGDICELMDVMVIRSTNALNDRVIGATYEDGIIQIATSTSDAASGTIDKYYETGWLHFGPPGHASRALWLDIWAGANGAEVEIYYKTDLNSDWTQIERVTRSYGSAAASIGKFVIGTTAIADGDQVHLRYELDTIFDMIAFKFASDGILGFELMGYKVEARVKGART